VPVPVDAGGLQTDQLPAAGARLVYVTPSHQHPTGAVLAPERRLALLEWANRHGAWVLEDDYDSEFRYGGPPLPGCGLSPVACTRGWNSQRSHRSGCTPRCWRVVWPARPALIAITVHRPGPDCCSGSAGYPWRISTPVWPHWRRQSRRRAEFAVGKASDGKNRNVDRMNRMDRMGLISHSTWRPTLPLRFQCALKGRIVLDVLLEGASTGRPPSCLSCLNPFLQKRERRDRSGKRSRRCERGGDAAGLQPQ
jgi:hypothetical protein